MNSGSSLYKGIDVSFVTGKKNREGSKTTLGRLLLIDDGEHLRVCDYQLRRTGQGLAGRLAACRWCSSSLSTFYPNSSRMVCTCGRMRRPLGACISWGITSRTTSPSLTQLPVIVCSPKFSGKLFENSIENALNAGTLFGTDHNGSLPAFLFNPKHHGSGVLTGIGFIQYQYHGDFARSQ